MSANVMPQQLHWCPRIAGGGAPRPLAPDFGPRHVAAARPMRGPIGGARRPRRAPAAVRRAAPNAGVSAALTWSAVMHRQRRCAAAAPAAPAATLAAAPAAPLPLPTALRVRTGRPSWRAACSAGGGEQPPSHDGDDDASPQASPSAAAAASTVAERLTSLAHVVEEAAAASAAAGGAAEPAVEAAAAAQLAGVLERLDQLEVDLTAAIAASPTASPMASFAPDEAAAPPPAPIDPASPVAPSTAEAMAAVQLAADAAVAAEMRAAAELQASALAATELSAAATAAAADLAAAAAPDAAAAAPAPAPAPTPSASGDAVSGADDVLASAKLWALFVLGTSYVHQATTGFALPALLPQVAPDLGLSDLQGAALTSGYSYLYALALVPVGLLADRVDRPRLLAAGLAAWSALSMLAGQARSFNELLLTRVGFAAAQAAQNPVAFSLIPDLFPANKSTALAAYNCAIYLGRALSFAGVLAANRLGGAGAGAAGVAAAGAKAASATAPAGEVALSMVPLDKLDLQHMSIIYTTGDMAAVTPVYNYNFHVIAYEATAQGAGGWRQLLFWLGVPGFLVAALMLASVPDPRFEQANARRRRRARRAARRRRGGAALRGGAAAAGAQPGPLGAAAEWVQRRLGGLAGGGGGAGADGDKRQPLLPAVAGGGGGGGGALALSPPSPEPGGLLGGLFGGGAGASAGGPAALAGLRSLAALPAFRAVTLAAALNDLGSYALIAWHSTFYERVFALDSSVYAPILAVVLPVGGIMGGVGGGLLADWLSTVGGRKYLTAGASVLAAPFIAWSLLAPSSEQSFLALLAGFALSEAWRAPGAVMIRAVAPAEMGSTASALYLCARNLVGGIGPLAVAKLAGPVGLRNAMLLAPVCYVASGVLFWAAEGIIERDARAQAAAAALLGAAAAGAEESMMDTYDEAALDGGGGDDGEGGGGGDGGAPRPPPAPPRPPRALAGAPAPARE